MVGQKSHGPPRWPQVKSNEYRYMSTVRWLFVFFACTSLACVGGEVLNEAASSSAPASSGVVNVDGAELGWVREGTGPTIFVLGSSVYYPKAYSEKLRDHFELVFVDGRHFVPGYQPGEKALAEIDLATFADEVEAVRQELGYGDITVLGHSIHGQIALEYADRYPTTTSRVVLVCPIPHSETAELKDQLWEELASENRRSVMADRLETLDEVMADIPPERQFAVKYLHRSPLYWVDPEYDAAAVFAGLESGPAFARLRASVTSRGEAMKRLRRVQAPILLILGRLDFAVPYTAWEELIEGVESIDYVLLPADSHNPQTEFPDRFDPVLIEWFEGH